MLTALLGAAFFLPLSEGIAEAALLLALAAGLVIHKPWRYAKLARSLGAPLAIVVGLTGYVWVGTSSLVINGALVRGSSLNKVLLSVGMVLGFMVARQVRADFLRRMLECLVLGSLVAALAGMWQICVGPLPLLHHLDDPARGVMGQLYAPGTDALAATGTLRNRMKLAGIWAFVLAALSAARLYAQDPRARRLAALGCLFFTIMLGLTYTKAPLGAVLATFALITLLERGWFRRWLWPALGFGIAGATVASAYAGAILARTDFPLSSDMWTTRRFIWHRAVLVIREHLWLGTGIGSYRQAAAPHFHDPMAQRAFTLNAHSQHLTALAETGVIGFLFWLLLLIGILLALRESWRTKLSGTARALRHLATFFLLTLAFMSLVHDVLFHPVTALLAWMCVGLLSVRAEPSADR